MSRQVVTNSWLCEEATTGLQIMVREVTTLIQVTEHGLSGAPKEHACRKELFTDGMQPAMWFEPGPASKMFRVFARNEHTVIVIKEVGPTEVSYFDRRMMVEDCREALKTNVMRTDEESQIVRAKAAEACRRLGYQTPEDVVENNRY